jgi:hydroxyethylthiazole kinase-like uncharacterized protein yjeF
MSQVADQVLSVAQMRAAEDALGAQGVSIDELMQRAGRGAAEWVWRMAAGHSVTVLCGPGNNGGDGYVIAEAIRERGGKVTVIAAAEPRTDAARKVRALYQGEVHGPDAEAHGEVFVDCLFGSGLTRELTAEHTQLLARLADNHKHAIAVDVPSGVDADSGALLTGSLPDFDLTLALGAWKFAHFLMPASAVMGRLQWVDIGVDAHPGAAKRVGRPCLSAPAADSHKYRRGLLAVIGGAMPGASILAATAAQGAGAGYVKLFCETADVPADLVVNSDPLVDALADRRIAALLAGPGLGRTAEALERMLVAIAHPAPLVLDADALVLLGERHLAERTSAVIATPHAGELAGLEETFGCPSAGSKPARAAALAAKTSMVIVAKGPDTVIAAPDGRLALAGRASSWLSTAGTGDVLAGAIASRLATGAEAFEAACQGVWLHGEAARLSLASFTAGRLAAAIPQALAATL